MRTLVERLAILGVAAAVLAAQPLLFSTPIDLTPYESALVWLPDSSAMAPQGCEFKQCYIAPDGNQSKCVSTSNASNCVIQSVHGRGHGRICTNQAC